MTHYQKTVYCLAFWHKQTGETKKCFRIREKQSKPDRNEVDTGNGGNEMVMARKKGRHSNLWYYWILLVLIDPSLPVLPYYQTYIVYIEHPCLCHRRVPLIYIDGVCEKNGNTGNGLGKSLKANLAGAGIEDAGYRQIF